jgi:hypothetical protein
MKPVALSAIGIGFLLLVLSSAWSALFPPTSSWTEEKAQRASKVKERLSNIGPIVTGATHNLYRGPDPATLKAEFDALKLENEQLNADFTSATEKPQVTSKILRWTGIVVAIVGIIGWYAVSQSR